MDPELVLLATVVFLPPSWAAMEALPVQRPRSIRSVASNSSIASGVSLSRRSRTRTRSKTVTGASRTDAVPRSPLPSDLPYLGAALVQEPEDVLDAPLQEAAPERPPRSPHRIFETTVDIRSTNETSSQDVSLADIEPTTLTSRPVRLYPAIIEPNHDVL